MATNSDRRQYKNRRFAIPDDAPFLMPQDKEPMVYPDVRLKVKTLDGREGEWRVVKDIERNAERIAHLYRAGIYEMINQPEYEWHIHPSEIIAKDQNGSAKIYAVFLEGDDPHNIVQVLSTTLIQPNGFAGASGVQ